MAPPWFTAPRSQLAWSRARVGSSGDADALVAMIATASYALGFAASTAPCDILAAAGTPCVAAHSMARALYATTPMGAPLYTVYREDDRLSTKTITVNSKGMADTDAQDAFCNGQWGHCIVL